MARASRSQQGTTGRVEPRRRVPPYEMLRDAIVEGQFEAGMPLVEMFLADWCQVSRTPIREALRRLEQDGLIVRSERGMIVRERSPEEILDIYETRIVLEATVGRIAADRRSELDLRGLEYLLQVGEQVNPGDHGAMVDANDRFHRAVWRSSHNESLVDLLDRLNLHLARYPGTTLASPGRWETAIQQHSEVVRAIAARDGQAAYDVAWRHFSEARDIRVQLFASSL